MSIEVRSRRVGGATYQVPVEVRPERRQAFAIRWLVGCCARAQRKHDGRASRGEIQDAANNRGNAGEEARRHAPDGGKPTAHSHYRW